MNLPTNLVWSPGGNGPHCTQECRKAPPFFGICKVHDSLGGNGVRWAVFEGEKYLRSYDTDKEAEAYCQGLADMANRSKTR